MSRYHSYLNTAATVLLQYNGNEPFSASLKKFFSQQKKYGSKDRKQIAHLCYCYFRLGKSLPKIDMDERILTALFLCSSEYNNILADLKPAWNEIIHLPLNEKIATLPDVYSQLLTQLFPWKEALSEGINPESFNKSFLIQPYLFLRIRPGYVEAVKSKLSDAEYESVVGSRLPAIKVVNKWFRQIGENCIELPNASKIEGIIELDKEAVVQDYSSQRISEFLNMVRPSRPDHFEIWDCCAASGGKSILAKDVLGDIVLNVSDIRESILVNLRKRFDKAGIKKYKSFICNLSVPDSRSAFGKPTAAEGLPSFDSELILCDVPCTGSGTWSRTPEQLFYFEPSDIGKYNLLQRKIVSNVIHGLKPGAHFLYITCSVFKKENEEMVSFIKEKFHLKLVKMELLKGYDHHADTLFAALFIA
jgi:16S rRNA (cytosine967-C5)-methyltransferase